MDRARRGTGGSTGRLASLGALISVSSILGACAVGPDVGPGLVIGDGGSVARTAAMASAPTLSKPTRQVQWRNCDADIATRYQFVQAAGAQFGCLTYQSIASPDRPQQDTVDVTAVRVTAATTPTDAAPLILTSGTDMPSSAVAALLAGSGGKSLLAARPVIAVDRRGIGLSGGIDCLTSAQRTGLWTNAFSPPTQAGTSSPRQDALVKLAQASFQNCSDEISPLQLAYNAANAATDIETLRTTLGADQIGIAGVGAGGDIALAYAAGHPSHLARLVLDTPAPYNRAPGITTRTTASGVQSALQSFADQCKAASCALGVNPLDALTTLVNRASTDGVGGFSDVDVLTALTTAIATGPADRAAMIRSVADIASSASGGNTSALASAVNVARSLRESDGQQVSRCDDIAAPIGRNEAATLVNDLVAGSPTVGPVLGMSALRCTGWPAGPARLSPASFAAPVLILNGSADPINGNGGVATAASIISAASGTISAVGYGGPGYSVLARSQCAADVATHYLANATVPSTTDCPA